jgi:hypothetical protein
MLIEAELSRKDYSSIPTITFEMGLEHLTSKLTLKSDSTGGKKKINIESSNLTQIINGKNLNLPKENKISWSIFESCHAYDIQYSY